MTDVKFPETTTRRTWPVARERRTRGLAVQRHSEESLAVICTWRAGEAPVNSIMGTLTWIDYIAVPATGLSPGPGQNWNPTSIGKEHTQA